MKTCFKCLKEKDPSEFYNHTQMADGKLGKCKDCCKQDVQKNYADKREQYAEYERGRSQQPERKAKATEYQRKRRAANPLKYKATMLVNNAVRDGRLIVLPCEVCFNTHDLQAHHDDYTKPLDVRWLCRKHHLEEHNKVAYKEIEI